jgi:hypothetical protein
MAVLPAVGVEAREIDGQVKQPGREVRVFV